MANPDHIVNTPAPTLASSQQHTTPDPLALRLGYAGLLPFVAGAILVWLLANQGDSHPFVFAVDALAKYAALIVSFLGGMNWGLVMRLNTPDSHLALVNRTLWTGIAFSVLAWAAVCMPAHAGLVVLGALLIASYLSDRKLYPQLGAAGWLQLRFRLTCVASLCCFLAAAQTY